MTNHETLVICLNAGNKTDFTHSLTNQDFGLVNLDSISSLRSALEKAVSDDYKYVITVDERDDYSIDDILKVAQSLQKDDAVFYMGTRSCTAKKSLPATLYGFLSGLDAEGVASSLYGMSIGVCSILAKMKSKDDAFLFNMPLEARANDIEVKEILTATACHEQPDFKLLTRSFKLYYVFIKFSIAAMIAYLVDIISFYFLEQAFASLADDMKILWATVVSRILCSIATYILNRGAVFKSHAKSAGAIVRFLILATGQLVASWLLVLGIGSLFGGGDFTNMLVKIIVDLVIFMASFTLQRDWVFKKTDGILR